MKKMNGLFAVSMDLAERVERGAKRSERGVLFPLPSYLIPPTSHLLALRSCLLALLLPLAAEVAAEETPLYNGQPKILSDGCTYSVSGTVEITGSAGQRSPLVLASGVACINLKQGATLKVTGYGASNTTGAGAGIEVGKDATLFITGDGEVIATGGKAANGQEGGKGNPATFSKETSAICVICSKEHSNWGVFKAGAGGNGGAGGGGAGAGIGGCGGAGGAGGTVTADITSKLGWRGRAHNDKNYLQDGINGVNGTDGSRGGEMGRVVVTGMARVRVYGGSRGNDYTLYKNDGDFYASAVDDLFLNLYTAVGGGAGGGGAGGGAASGIGGGGGGGGGGGSGGTGGYFEFNAWNAVEGYKGSRITYNENISLPASYPLISGRGGRGGAGEKGTAYGDVRLIKHDPQGTHKNGDGGAGGYSAGVGGAGSVYVTLRAGLEDQAAWRYAPPPPVAELSKLVQKKVKIVFNDRGTIETDESKSFLETLPAIVPPTRVGYRFAGWWTSPKEGNICFYDREGTPMMPYIDQLDDINLEARWEVDPSVLVVTSSDDPADGERNDMVVTLRDAVKMLCDHQTLIGTNGARRITFALPEDNCTIRLTRPIIVPVGTAPFEIFGLSGSRAVTIDGGGKTRLFDLRGDGVTFSHLMFTGGKPSELGGGAILCDNSFMDAVDCVFLGNSASEGGAVCAKNALAILRNCTFAGNSASFRYGAVSASGLAVVLNCTFSENSSKGLDSSTAALGLSGNGLVAHCTFARNGKSLAVMNLPGSESSVTAVNCIFADGAGAVVGGKNNAVKMLYSGETEASAAFVGGGLPQTNRSDEVKLYGMKHVWYEPRQSDENFDAALIYYDGYSAGSAIAVSGVKTNILFGTAETATIPILADQLRSVRYAPVRGAIRVLSGEDRPGVTLEGIYKAGASKKHDFNAIVRYDDGQLTESDISVEADADGFFAVRLPVEGSDGTAHNAVSCWIEGLNSDGDQPMSIATLPYAFTASSASVLLTGDQDGSDKDLELTGDAVTMNRAVTDTVTVGGEGGWLEVASQSFSAGTVRGFGRIELKGVDVTEGRLDVLQDRNDEGKTGALTYGYLTAMTANGGGNLPLDNGNACINGGTSVAAKTTKTLDFGRSAAKSDGFVQIFVRLPAKRGNKIGLKVGSLVVTPLGSFGEDGRERRFLWTVPVRKGDIAELTLTAGDAEMSVAYQRQYMYFGVLSASELDDVEK